MQKNKNNSTAVVRKIATSEKIVSSLVIGININVVTIVLIAQYKDLKYRVFLNMSIKKNYNVRWEFVFKYANNDMIKNKYI